MITTHDDSLKTYTISYQEADRNGVLLSEVKKTTFKCTIDGDKHEQSLFQRVHAFIHAYTRKSGDHVRIVNIEKHEKLN